MSESTLDMRKSATPEFLEQLSAPRKAAFLKGYAPLLAALVTTLLFITGLLVSYKIGEMRRIELIESLGQRASVAIDTRVNAINTWRDSQIGLLAPIHQGEAFRLFAAEQAHAQNASPAQSGDQLRFLQSTFDDILGRADARSGRLVGPDGTAWLASADAPPLDESLRSAARDALAANTLLLLPAHIDTAGHLVTDLLVPLHPLQALTPDAASKAVAVLIVTLPVDSLFQRLAKPDRLSQPWEAVRLFQTTNSTVQEIVPGAIPPIMTVKATDRPDTLSYGLHTPIGGGEFQVISLGRGVPGTPWAVVHESDASAALAPATTMRTISVVISFLFSSMVGIILLAVSWRSANGTNQALADQYRAFAARQAAHKRFQDSVNNAVHEMLYATDAKGRLVYVNKAFCEIIGIRAEAANGLPLEAMIEDHATVMALHRHDDDARAGISVPTYTIDAKIDDGPTRCLTISKTALLDEHEVPIGVVTVARDVTVEREQARRHAKAIKSTVHALSRTVEAADPHLADHARKLEQVAVALGHRLDLPEDDLAALEMAANLSQIGKLFVPHDLLTKTARLSEDERRQVEKHVLHALELLSDVDFDVPVLNALGQMNELLDGTGYPFGLKGEAVGHLGRILSVCDVFVARTSKRAYRESTSAENVLDILTKHPDRYDATVVAALQAAVDDGSLDDDHP